MRPTKREFVAANAAYYWAHLLLLLGIISDAAGLEQAIGHPFDRLDFAFALALGGGTALYLLGHALFRAFLGLPFRPWRGFAAVLALATIPLGTEASALAQLGALVAILAICLAVEGAPARAGAVEEPVRS
jgi:low temperature requirement protein LtrA